MAEATSSNPARFLRPVRLSSLAARLSLELISSSACSSRSSRACMALKPSMTVPNSPSVLKSTR
ncbi:hypothetical protein [Breoghania sp.]|uniref:hypothetical protein n=1 Tax=Breoghania sp. TaxID=2065378 RepID=UPI0026054D55|nr:hypothetical protein [Breoghania sp.]MDJ0932031.1 hypothetical protein [Breoghania sp.]